MDEQRIQVTNIPLFPVVGREWIMISICFVKGPFKASEQRGHGQVHASMAVINGRIYQYGPAMLITKEIAAPQVAMYDRARVQQCWNRTKVTGVALAGGSAGKMPPRDL